jgi:hypothetical protein
MPLARAEEAEAYHRARLPLRDDDVVDERCADCCGSLGNGTSEGHILITRSRVAARVVVDENEGAGGFSQYNQKHIAYANVKAMNAAGGHAPGGAETMATVQAERPQLFVLQGRKPGASPGDDAVAVDETWQSVERCCLDRTASQLDSGDEPCCFGRTNTAPGGELADPRIRQRSHAVFDQRSGQGGEGHAATARSEEHGHELRVTQALDPQRDCALTGMYFVRWRTAGR